MPTITLSKKDLLHLVGKPLPDAQLKERISMLGTDLEHIKGDEIQVEVFPNRPDMLSEEGFARALSSFVGKKMGLRTYKVQKSDYKVIIDAKVKEITPAVSAAVVKGVKFDEAFYASFMELQEKLCLTHGRKRKKLAMGAYDLNTLQFPLTYTAKNPDFRFQPLEMHQEMSLSNILIRHPKGKEFAHLLDGYTHYPIWIDHEGEVLSMPPVINSEPTKVTLATKDLFLEVTGTDQQAVDQALHILVTACADRGGKIYAVNDWPNLEPTKMAVELSYVNQLLGLALKQEEFVKLIERMGYGYQNEKVLVPAYRVDVLHPMDVVEDVAIAYGYERFTPEIPKVGTVGEENKFEKFKQLISRIMVGYGLLETNTHHLSNLEDQQKNMHAAITPVPLTNALNQDYSVLRAWMLPSLIKVLQGNKHHDYPQKIFEIGTVFSTEEEFTRIGCALTGDVGYTDARQLLDGLFRSLGVEGKYKEADHGSFISGRVARVSVKGKKMAYIGELHPEVLTNFGLEMPATCFELNLSELYALLQK